MIERYSFVAITAGDLGRMRRFYVEQLGFPVIEEEPGHFFVVDAGGLRLCVDTPDGDVHRAGGTDPVIGLKVTGLEPILDRLGAGLLSDGAPRPPRGPGPPAPSPSAAA